MSSRSPTYSSGVNFLKLFMYLLSATGPVSSAKLRDYLDVSHSTLIRYIKTINLYLSCSQGGKLIKFKMIGGRKYFYISKTFKR